jgi:hypothetical protein
MILNPSTTKTKQQNKTKQSTGPCEQISGAPLSLGRAYAREALGLQLVSDV